VTEDIALHARGIEELQHDWKFNPLYGQRQEMPVGEGIIKDSLDFDSSDSSSLVQSFSHRAFLCSGARLKVTPADKKSSFCHTP
jgi:hypothetical protein